MKWGESLPDEKKEYSAVHQDKLGVVFKTPQKQKCAPPLPLKTHSDTHTGLCLCLSETCENKHCLAAAAPSANT